MKDKRVLYLILLSAMVILSFYGIFHLDGGIHNALYGVKNCGFWAPIIYIAFYALAPTFFIPITPFLITAGVLFGPMLGTIYAALGGAIGGTIAFLVSRYIMKDWVDQKTPARVALIKEKVKEKGWQFVAISRISPIFPFNVQNYIFGLTEISVKTFFVTTLFSLVPGTFVYVYIGYAGKNIFTPDKDTVAKVLFAVTMLILFAFLPKIIEVLKKNLVSRSDVGNV